MAKQQPKGWTQMAMALHRWCLIGPGPVAVIIVEVHYLGVVNQLLERSTQFSPRTKRR